MKPHWGQVLAVFAAVVVVGVVTVLLVANTESEPGAGSRPTSIAAPTAPTKPAISAAPRPKLTVDSGCRIGQGTTQLATVPQGVTDRVTKVWERIEKWLAAKAPKTAEALAPPATLDQISQTQQQIGVPVPAELIASLLRHDGVGGSGRPGFSLPPFYRPMSVADIAAYAKSMCKVLADLGDDHLVGWWWHGQVVPFARDVSAGNLLLDQRPGRNGHLGDHSEESEMDFDDYPPTLAELLELTATSLETGDVVLDHYRPKVIEDGILDWEIIP